jgi:hypothetical protein
MESQISISVAVKINKPLLILAATFYALSEAAKDLAVRVKVSANG